MCRNFSLAMLLLVPWLSVSMLVASEETHCGFEHCLNASSSAGNGSGGFLEALKTARRYNSSIEIALSGGPFCLDEEIGELLTFVNWSNFSLRGQGREITTLHCVDKDVGLVFRNSSHVTLRDLTVERCARRFTTTSINMSESDTGDHNDQNVAFVVSRTGIFFDSCSTLTLDGVKVFNSSGMGVTVYNTNGTNLFDSCWFEANHLDAEDRALGGGGVVIETSHCVPGDSTCTDERSKLETVDALYSFNHCYFFTNRATSHYLRFNSVYPHGRDHVGVGRGGGLAVVFRGRALRNQVILDDCHFRLNVAEWGGALYLNFGDISVSNSVVIRKSGFTTNNFRYGGSEDLNSVTAGGGMRVEVVSYPADEQLWPGYVSNVTNNSVAVHNTLIISNHATWGAGVSFVTTRDLPGESPPNSLLFESCTFKENTAQVVGSAIDISSWKPDLVDSAEPFLRPILQDCTFDSNKMIFSNITNYPVGVGIVYIAGVPTTFVGRSLFLGNQNTALVVSQTYISVLNSSVMNFTGNTGRRGGALAFIGSSWLITHENTSFLFDGNWVGTYGLGGAVYSVHFGEHDLSYDQNCFFRYYKYSLPPDQWNSIFTFRDNSADGKPSSIYTTSSRPCDWNAAAAISRNGSSPVGGGAFCENATFVFEGLERGCWNEIATGPSEVRVKKINIEVYPGWPGRLGVNVINDFGQPVPPVLVASPSREEDKETIAIANSTNYIADDTIVIHGKENSSASLLLMTLDPRVVASEVVVWVKSCPPGFVPTFCPPNSTGSEFGMTCDCVCQQSVPGIECNDDTKEAYILPYNCITLQSENSTKTAVGSCPYNQRNRFKISDLALSNLDKSICGHYHRRGFLCSRCQEDFGVSVNTHDYRCVKCKGRERYNWVLYLLLELGPITIVCFLVILFGVGVSSPLMNAFVFFSQIVSVTYNTNRNIWFFGAEVYHQSLATAIYVLYGIWNLEFFRDVFPPICLHQELRTLHILVINYVKALYPMLLLGVCYVLIKLYDRNTKALHVLWKPFRYCQKAVYRIHKPKTSIIDAFATLIILSYSKFMYVSFPLLTLISIYELGENATEIQRQEKYRYYFDPDEVLHHSTASIIYFILGIVVVVVFVGLPPIFLILYPLRVSQRLVGKLNMRVQITLRTFADIFLGAFRDGTSGGGGGGGGGEGSGDGGSGGGGGGGRDYRWFAGLYFIMRITFMSLYASTVDRITEYLIQQILCTLCLFLFAILRPYKVDIYNALDCGFFALLAILNALSFNNSSYWENKQHLQGSVFFINYLLVFLPMIYLVTLLTYLVLSWRGYCSCVGRKGGSEEVKDYDENSMVSEDEGDNSSDARSTLDTDRLLPDRLVNPNNYRTLDRMPSTTSSGGSFVSVEPQGGGRGEGQRHRQPSTDQNPLLQDHRLRAYGNIQRRDGDRATA